jgi:hypothetical protein
MNMKKIIPACFIMAMIFGGLTCSKAPIIPQASNRVVLGELFTHDM